MPKISDDPVVRALLVLTAEDAEAIETYRSALRPIPSRNEAIRRLIRLGLGMQGGTVSRLPPASEG
jgi:hypothetical protein